MTLGHPDMRRRENEAADVYNNYDDAEDRKHTNRCSKTTRIQGEDKGWTASATFSMRTASTTSKSKS